MSKRILVSVVAFFAGMVCLNAGATEAFKLPADLVSLIPEHPAVLVALSSLNEFADQYLSVAQMVGEDVAREDALAVFGEELSNAENILDLDRPLLVAVGLFNIVVGQRPPFTYILPLRSGFTDYQSVGGGEIVVRRAAGDYLALADWADYLPAAETPALTGGLTAGLVAASFDVAQIVEEVGPFLDMGLAMIPTEEGADPALTAAMADAIHRGLNALVRWDASVGRDGEFMNMATKLTVKPGSALDPGPQPDFGRALALTGSLPADADFVQAVAIDQTRVMHSFEDYYVLAVQQSLRGMDVEHSARFGAWVRDYIDNMTIWSSPMAAALQLDGEQLAAHGVFEPADPVEAVFTLSRLLDEMNDLGIGFTLKRHKDKKVAGVKFHVWDVAVDDEVLAAVMPESTGPDVTGLGRLQAGQMLAILEKVTAPIYVGSDHGKVFLATAEDQGELEHIVKSARKNTKPRALAKAVAAKAGPACQQVLAGDFMSVLNWMTGFAAEFSEDDLEALQGVPIPVEAAVTIDGTQLGVEMGMDLPALGHLVETFAAMADDDDDDAGNYGNYDDDDDDDHDDDEHSPAAPDDD